MFALGPTELVVFFVVALLVFGPTKLLGLAGAVEKGAVDAVRAAAAPAVPRPIPDVRYRLGVPAGNVAQLFGLQVYGINTLQVLVLVAGLWLAGNTFYIERLIEGTSVDSFPLWRTFGDPVFFMFSSLVAIRSFQGRPSVTVFTGLLFAALDAALQYASFGVESLNQEWWRSAALSFAWAALTMLAVQFSASGMRRWIRMAFAFAVASVFQRYLFGGLYSGEWDPERFFEFIELGLATTVLIPPLLRTFTFWIALRLCNPR